LAFWYVEKLAGKGGAIMETVYFPAPFTCFGGC